MNIREQVKELRTIAEAYRRPPYGREIIGTEEALSKAADTIEALSAKLQATNTENGSGWITDRAPTKEECGSWRGRFLVTVYANELKTMYMEYEYATTRGREIGRWIWHDRVNIPWEVVAWRKLPEPYRP